MTKEPKRYHSGERHTRAILTEQQAQAIVEDTRSLREIALAYGVSMSAAASIKQGITWAHLDRSKVFRASRGGNKLSRSLEVASKVKPVSNEQEPPVGAPSDKAKKKRRTVQVRRTF